MSAYAFPFTEIEYPDSDGLPMAESDFQREYLSYAVEALRGYFRDRNDVYVSGNLLLYYEEGNGEGSFCTGSEFHVMKWTCAKAISRNYRKPPTMS